MKRRTSASARTDGAAMKLVPSVPAGRGQQVPARAIARARRHGSGLSSPRHAARPSRRASRSCARSCWAIARRGDAFAAKRRSSPGCSIHQSSPSSTTGLCRRRRLSRDGAGARRRPAPRAAARGPARAAARCAILTNVCTAIEAAHREGVLHRDLKPENILLPGGGAPAKVLDFGVAKLIGEDRPESGDDPDVQRGTIADGSRDDRRDARLHGARTVQGTSPDARTDVFSLGVIAYEMLSGELPFGRGTLADVVLAQARGVPADAGDAATCRRRSSARSASALDRGSRPPAGVTAGVRHALLQRRDADSPSAESLYDRAASRLSISAMAAWICCLRTGCVVASSLPCELGSGEAQRFDRRAPARDRRVPAPLARRRRSASRSSICSWIRASASTRPSPESPIVTESSLEGKD